MPLVRGIRLLNSLETGNVSGACLETIVSCPARAADFVSILQSPGFACLAASSNTSTHAVTRSNTAMNTLAQTTVGACIYYTTPAFANNFAQSGPAFDNILTSNDSFKHFSNSALTMNCAFAAGSQFITCAAASNTNLARMFTCPITTCCIFGSASAMAGLANNANIVSFLFNDATAAACFSTYGGATAVCNAFNGIEYINYILQPGKTCAALACTAIGPYAFTNATSANCFIKNACALCVLVNLPACCCLGTSCTFTCFAASQFGIPCATTEYLAGNTSFVSQVFALNACAQLGGLVAKNNFVTCYYCATTPFSDKFNCFWQNCCNSSCGGRGCCPQRTDLTGSVGFISDQIGSTFGVRTPCMECHITQQESQYYHTGWTELLNSLSVSNNGNFMVLGGGFGGPGDRTYPMCVCCDGVNYCNTLCGAPDHTTAKTTGFFVCCPAMLYSNTNGCTWNRFPGFCIPNTFFQCLCCDGFAQNECTALTCAKVQIQWGLGSFTCDCGIWTGFRISNLCCRIHAIFGYACTCLLANNTPGAWTVCMRPHPFTNVTWCCGYFSGIGGECDFNNFSVTSPNSGLDSCYSNAPSGCAYRGAMRPRFIMGKSSGTQPSVASCISASACPCVGLVCNPICHGICGTCFCNGVVSSNCERMSCFPFAHMQDQFLNTGTTSTSYNPLLSFMTCVNANTADMTAWLMQVDSPSVRTWYYRHPGMGISATCTVLRWNCGNVCQCSLRDTIIGCAGSACSATNVIGGAVPIGNTLLWMMTPVVVDSTCTFASPCWISFNCDRCSMRPFFVTCSQFAWGTGTLCCPDGYQQSGLPFTPCDCCTGWTSETGCCASCTEQASFGFVTQFEPSSNTFVSITCIGCVPSCGYMTYFNYPNAGNTATEIYGCCACGASVWPPRGVSGHFCNIGATMNVNKGTGPFGTTHGAFMRESVDSPPGCTKPAFCKSFMFYHCSNRLVGWPCAIVYSGSCCWNWGPTPCSPCSNACSPASLWCMGCSYTNAGRCGFSGGSYGWMQSCIQPGFTCVCAFGTACGGGACLAPRLVCTANSMPAVVAGTFLCGTGFYANGQPYTTCVFKLRFIDMF